MDHAEPKRNRPKALKEVKLLPMPRDDACSKITKHKQMSYYQRKQSKKRFDKFFNDKVSPIMFLNSLEEQQIKKEQKAIHNLRVKRLIEIGKKLGPFLKTVKYPKCGYCGFANQRSLIAFEKKLDAFRKKEIEEEYGFTSYEGVLLLHCAFSFIENK